MHLHTLSRHLPPHFLRALLYSQLLAVMWWLIACWIRTIESGIPVWYDQRQIFTLGAYHLADPYQLPRFVNPPWTVLFFAPFSLVPLSIAVLAQLCLYFGLITGVVFKYSGNVRAVLISLTSFITFDAALELNIDWIVALGLIVPAAFSAPFLLAKPQSALGVIISYKRKEFVHFVLISLITIILAFTFWDAWPIDMLDAIDRNRDGLNNATHNMAPSVLLPAPLAYGIGLALGYLGFSRRDPILSIFAWLCFVPYVANYSLVLPLALHAIRWPLTATITNITMWIIYGGIILLYVVS